MSAEIAGPVTLSMMEMETSQTIESTAEQEPSALAAVPVTESTDADSEAPSLTHLNPLAASFIPSFESSLAPILLSQTSLQDSEEVAVEEVKAADAETAANAVEESVDGTAETPASVNMVQTEDAAEIKDDIMISQTVEILEPVLADARQRGESPALEAGDVEETEGVELSNEDIADDDDEENGAEDAVA